MAASAAAQENIYLRSLLAGFNRTQHGPTTVWEDNAACILMSENPVNRERSRHVDVKFHFLRERVHLGEIKLFKCLGTQNVADADLICVYWFFYRNRCKLYPVYISGLPLEFGYDK